MIRPATHDDAESISRIYNHYVLNTAVTFEEAAVSVPEMAGRMEEVRSLSLPWLVIEREGDTAGYAFAAQWKARRGLSFLRGNLHISIP